MATRRFFAHRLQTKIPSSTIRDEGIPPRYHPAYAQTANVTLMAVTGVPVADYLIHQRSLSWAEPKEVTGEFSLAPGIPVGCR